MVSHRNQVLGQTILQVYGRGPDVLIVTEVENYKALERLNREGLSPAGYQTVILLEGQDPRGIDIGLLSRLPLAREPKLHPLDLGIRSSTDRRPIGTRGVLQVPLKLPNGKILHVFGVHFPSQASPTPIRAKAVEQLVRILKSIPPEEKWVVGGDFNITGLEDDQSGLVSKTLANEGLVSHLVGCKNCKGTHNYRGVWNFLDFLVFSPHFKAGGQGAGQANSVRLIKDSIWTPKSAPNQLDRSGRPWRFDHESKQGVSDHLPIYAEFEISEPITVTR